MTIGELREELEDWPQGDEIIFGCEELEFYRFKKRGADTVQLEFNQTIYKDTKTGKWHKVRFMPVMRTTFPWSMLIRRSVSFLNRQK